MDRRDEIRLPDGRVMPYRRVQDQPAHRRARAALAARRESPRPDRAASAATGERGRHLDIVV
jgi:hypothetical protein